MAAPDVRVSAHENVFVFEPVTPRAAEWVAEHVQVESWQWVGGGFAVDQHYARDLAEAMAEAGLVLE